MARGGIRIQTRINKKLSKQILKGIYEACNEVLDDAKGKMIEGHKPETWDGFPRMQDELRLTGLDKADRKHALLNSWIQTIDSIKIDRRTNKISFNLFNSEKMNNATKWIGVSDIPDFVTIKKGNTWTTVGLKNNVAIQYGDSAYRPISNGIGTYWDWDTNPYPGYGYWLYHEQGYGAYAGNPFVKRAYQWILGESASDLLGPNEKKLNWVFLQKLVESCAKNVQRNVKYGNI